jgi:hypothetical protein
MPDNRTDLEKKLWDTIGPPLYYCAECMKAVQVKSADDIQRPCQCNAQIIAPRKAIAHGEGGMNMTDRIKLGYWQLGAALTGRCV